MLHISLLGQFDLRLPAGVPLPLPSRPAQSLLAYLVLGRAAAHRRERLAGVLWPDATEANARGYLRQALWRVRRALAPAGRDYLLSDDLTIQFDTSAPFSLDVAVLEDADDSLAGLRSAAEAYRGELLPGFYADWTVAERERLQSVYDAKLARLLEALAAARRWPEAVEWAERWLTLSGAQEPAYRGLMRAHGALGNRAAVAAAYQRCAQTLEAALGVGPSAQTQAVYETALRAADAPAPPAAAPAPRHQLPAPTTPFVGREHELREVAARLGQPDCRLLTLTGPGGIGKTRLALEAARGLAAQFTDGVCLVPLALTSSAEYLAAAMAEALGLSLYGGQPAEAQLLSYLRGRAVLLVVDSFEHLLGGAGLLNTLLAEAPRVKLLVTSQERLSLSGEWLLAIEGLPRASAMELFAASAQRLGATAPLSEHDQEAVARICQLVEGMPLGLELAAAWLRALPVDEIAAAIAREAGFLAASLRDLPPRHRSLQAVFDHSWQRLGPDEQAVYRRLAVLRGSFEREAAASVAGATLAGLAALMDKSLLHANPAGRYEMHGLLSRYALAQLAQAGETEAARDRHLDWCVALAEAAEPRLRRDDQLAWLARLEAEHDNLRAALEWSLAGGQPLAGLRLAGALSRFWYLRGYWLEGRQWLRRLLERVSGSPVGAGVTAEASPDPRRRTADDGRQALNADGDDQDRLAVVLARAKAWAGLGWLANEALGEQTAYAESLALYRAAGDDWGTAYALRGLGARAWNVGEAELAEALLAESLALFERRSDDWGQGLVRLNQGWVAHDADDLARAGDLWSEALACLERSGDRWGRAVALSNLGYLARLRLDDAGAAAHSEAALALFQALGDKAGTATSLVRLGQVALRHAHFDQARQFFEQTLAVQRELEYSWEAVVSLAELGLIAAVQGDYARARELFGEGLKVEGGVRDYTPLGDLLYNQGLGAYYEGDLALAETAWHESEARYQDQDDAVSAALARAGLGRVAWRRGDAARAHAMLIEALATARAGEADRRDLARVLVALGQVTLALGQAVEAVRLLEEAKAYAKQLGDKHALAEALEGLAAARVGEPAIAESLLAEARALREAIGAPRPRVEQA